MPDGGGCRSGRIADNANCFFPPHNWALATNKKIRFIEELLILNYDLELWKIATTSAKIVCVSVYPSGFNLRNIETALQI